jgi:hypothetical protein
MSVGPDAGPGMRTIAWLSASLFLLAAPLGGQDKPDFSGRWILEDWTPASSDVARVLTVRHSLAPPPASDLTIERESAAGVRSDSYRIGIVGGVVGGIDSAGRGFGPDGQRPQSRFSVTWQGDELVIALADYSGSTRDAGPWVEHTEVWSLDAEDTLRITATDRRPGEPPVTRTLTYRTQ